MNDTNTNLHYDKIPTFPEEAKKKNGDVVYAVMETPQKTRHKYAFDAKIGIFMLKHTLASGLEWPYDYGFIPRTLGHDGDPLDILLLQDEPTFPGCLVKARILGIIRIDKNAVQNDRIIACSVRMSGTALTTDKYDDVSDLPEELIHSLCRFLIEYSAEQGNQMEFKGVQSKDKAMEAIAEGIKAFKKAKKKSD
ncbi:MAG: inorganic diphosphatase [Candidatus Eremiobacteraeota bacterium]|nr:inorganic diphosphatase [Candidatus Eremiobacteraeota bacterium]